MAAANKSPQKCHAENPTTESATDSSPTKRTKTLHNESHNVAASSNSPSETLNSPKATGSDDANKPPEMTPGDGTMGAPKNDSKSFLELWNMSHEEAVAYMRARGIPIHDNK